jgi:hypothetical protein
VPLQQPHHHLDAAGGATRGLVAVIVGDVCQKGASVHGQAGRPFLVLAEQLQHGLCTTGGGAQALAGAGICCRQSAESGAGGAEGPVWWRRSSVRSSSTTPTAAHALW